VSLFYFSPKYQGLLSGLILGDRLSGAYLFSGSMGSYLRNAALFLGMGLQCQAMSQAGPCMVCQACLAVKNGTSVRYTVLPLEGKMGVDEIRQLQDQLRYGVEQLGQKWVVVLPNCDTMSTEAANAFLKTLEEPPEGVVFVLLTYQVQSVLPTIRSRCQRLDFPLGDTALASERAAIDLSLHPELIRVRLEKDIEFETTFMTFDQLLALDSLSRLQLVQGWSTSKSETLLLLNMWLYDVVRREDFSVFSLWVDRLVDTISDMKYNVQVRVQLESLLISLPNTVNVV